MWTCAIAKILLFRGGIYLFLSFFRKTVLLFGRFCMWNGLCDLPMCSTVCVSPFVIICILLSGICFIYLLVIKHPADYQY